MNSTLKVQNDIKDNAEDLQNFLKDLESWEKEIKGVDDNLSTGKSPIEEKKSLPPVRSQTQVNAAVQEERKKKQKVAQEESNGKEVKRISSYDYAAWDKFDVDKALESDEEKKDEGRESKEERKKEAVALKDEGNKYYSVGKLKEAVVKYTQAIALDPSNPALSANRSMAYIKMERFEEAELDCNRCLTLDPTYIKAVLRRATARRALGKIDLAKQDYVKVLQLEPWNKDAKKELEILKKNPQGKTEVGISNECCNVKSSINTHEKSQTRSSTSPEAKLQCKSETSVTSFPKTNNASNQQKNEEGKEKRKKLKVVEVNSAIEDQDNKRTIDETDSNVVLPIKKSPHQQSQKLLRRLGIQEVSTRADIPRFTVPHSEDTSKVSQLRHSCQGDRQEKEPKSKATAQPKNITQTTEKKSSPSKDESVKVPSSSVIIPAHPRTSHQFAQHWQMLKNDTKLALQYLQGIKVEFFKGIEIETDTIIDVARILSHDTCEVETAVKYMRALISTTGFTVNLLFLEDHQKKELNKVIGKCIAATEVEDLLQLQEKLK
ncbi:uncharacterized protein LOC143036403 [Oratosquilla oratoria]|uniref:uncharacterized protein LOC143036403 n=1 Tax=Oratosquilla oratoria TaxID=337810 RepID=UPI003F76E999